MEKAHDQGIVHRDLKPENLMLVKGSRGRTVLKIVDFGIASMVRGNEEDLGERPSDIPVVGTPYYMSPEQALGAYRKVDKRTDLYACGAILFELLTGRHLFSSKKPIKILEHQIKTPPPQLESLPGKRHSSLPLQNILNRALAKKPSERFQSALEFFSTLSVAMEKEGVIAEEEGIDEVSSRNSSQNNLLALAMGQEDNNTFHSGEKVSKAKALWSNTSLPEISVKDEKVKRYNKSLWWALSTIGIIVASLLIFVVYSRLVNFPSKGAVIDAGNKSRIQEHKQKARTSPRTIVRIRPRPSGVTPRISSTIKKNNTVTPSPRIKKIEKKNAVIKRVQWKRRRRRRRYRRRRKRRIISRRRRRKHLPNHKVHLAVVPQKKTYTLSIATTPSSAKVFINKKFRGKTPYKLILKEGKRVLVQIKKNKYVTQKFYWKSLKNTKESRKLIEDLF